MWRAVGVSEGLGTCPGLTVDGNRLRGHRSEVRGDFHFPKSSENYISWSITTDSPSTYLLGHLNNITESPPVRNTSSHLTRPSIPWSHACSVSCVCSSCRIIAVFISVCSRSVVSHLHFDSLQTPLQTPPRCQCPYLSPGSSAISNCFGLFVFVSV